MFFSRQNVACKRGCRSITRSSYRAPRKVNSHKSFFPHGFSATEHLVPPSNDNSTPITDALPRSPLLDPTTYTRKRTYRVSAPQKNEKLTPLEKSILENPFAKVLASPIRRDRSAEHVLPRSLLLKFVIFQSEENYWLMPADLPPHPVRSRGVSFRGVYARLNKRLITELSAKSKRWKNFVPEKTSPVVRKKLVWREGMTEWIEGILTEESWKRLDRLPRKFLFWCEVEEGLEKAVVGRNIGKRIKLKGRLGTEGVEGEVASTEASQQSPAVSESENGAEATDPVKMESTGNQTADAGVEDTASDDNKREGPIIAVLYLPPPDTTDTWDFKPVDVEGQDTPAVMFNLRCLFPLTAESYMALRVDQGNALAIMSSEMSCTIIHHLLRLALYLEPAESNTLEENVDINPPAIKNEG